MSDPKDVIAYAVWSEKLMALSGPDADEKAAELIINALDAGGYVILPKEPTEAMTNHPEYTGGNWSRRNWKAILRSVGGE